MSTVYIVFIVILIVSFITGNIVLLVEHNKDKKDKGSHDK